jgi:molecular chaperone HtpG
MVGTLECYTHKEKVMTNAKKKENMTDNKMDFTTDVARLLDIVANALYSNRDVFLRELISNAADACDRLRYEALQNQALTKGSRPFHIRLTPLNEDLSLTITDNGIGMNKEDLIENLGTIARSGTAAILDQLQNKDDMNLIGQFGVGFYASFMVAKQVEVISQKAGDMQAYYWESDGRTGYTIREATKEEQERLIDGHGTIIKLSMKPDAIDYLLEDKIKEIVLSYSDHIEIPIYLDDKHAAELGKEDEQDKPINTASALWTRPKNEITEDQYKEFYHHIGNVFDDPTLTLHWKAEGKFEYTALLYVPSMRPWDLYDPERKNALRLYVKRVFITDSIETLMYPWLRFVRGIVDSQDLPLNISREMLQSNPVLQKIRNGLTKKILNEMDKLSRDDEESFLTLWHQFGMVIKEGLYDAFEHRPAIFKICRFMSTHDENKPTSLAGYIDRMKDGQDKIYYIAGENAESLRNSPQLEGLKAKGIEVLLMTDTVDEFWLQQINEYEGKTFQSVTKGNIDLSDFDDKKEEDKDEEALKEERRKAKAEMEPLLNLLHEELSDHIAFARVSRRLTESPVCLVAGDQDVDMHMEKVLKIQQKYEPHAKKILEINADHPLIKKLRGMIHDKETTKSKDVDTLKEAAHMLLDQALIIQGEPVPNPSEFAKRMAKFMEKGLL